ncbi:MAG: hypothetical protein ABIN94_04860 [Ferruginibacter sp.]
MRLSINTIIKFLFNFNFIQKYNFTDVIRTVDPTTNKDIPAFTVITDGQVDEAIPKAVSAYDDAAKLIHPSLLP